MRELICGVELGGYYEKDGQIWKVVSIAQQPTMTLENIETKERVGGVIGAPIFTDFVELIRRPDAEQAGANLPYYRPT